MPSERLFDVHARSRKRRGEVAVDRAIAAARKAGVLEDLDAGAAAAARILARRLDALEADPDVGAGTLAYVAAELRKTLVELQLTPASRGEAIEDDDTAGELAAVLRIGAAARRDADPGRG